MPLVRVLRSSHEKLKHNQVYRIIIRSHSFAFRKAIHNNDPLVTLLSLKIFPDEIEILKIIKEKKNAYLNFQFKTKAKIFSIDLESIDLPVEILYEKIKHFIAPNSSNNNDLQELINDESDKAEAFLQALELFVSSSYQRIWNNVKKSAIFLQSSLKIGFNQVKEITGLLNTDRKDSLSFSMSNRLPLDLIENKFLINGLVLNVVDSKRHSLEEMPNNQDLLVSKKVKNQKVIIFIHSIILNWKIWKPYMLEFYPNYRVIAYDLRGHGSSEIHKKDYKIKDYMNDFFELINVLKIDRSPIELTIITHSLTGLFVLHALQNTKKIPQSLNKLVLLSSGDKISSELQKVLKNLPPTFLWNSMKSIGIKNAKKFIFSPNVIEKCQNDILEIVLQTDNKVIATSLKNFSNKSFLRGIDESSKFNISVLVIIGSKDVFFPLQTISGLEKFSNIVIRIFEGKNHFFPFETPNLVFKEIKSWLNQEIPIH